MPSGTFPLVPDYPHGRAWQPEVAIHQFGSGNAKIEQRFLPGTGAKRFTIRKAFLREAERNALRDFWKFKVRPLRRLYVQRSQRRRPRDYSLHLPLRQRTTLLVAFEGIEQSMGGEADQATFTFGNADRVMRDLANDVDLFRAEISLSLFHVSIQAEHAQFSGSFPLRLASVKKEPFHPG